MSSLSCPLPLAASGNIQLAHGSGGQWMHDLIESVFYSSFENPYLSQKHDATVVPSTSGKLAVTTDAYVVSPLFFPGGDIGTLAVTGTINDLAMSGAIPKYLTATFIIEEGFAIADLKKIAVSMQEAAQLSQVHLIAGDTKVVDKGKADGVFISTTGVGFVEHHLEISPKSVQIGDCVLVSGDLGRHGVTILAKRHGLELGPELISDCAPLHQIVDYLISEGIRVRCLRDLTRGGLATALNEIATLSQIQFEIEESRLAIQDPVHAAAELLGLDPLTLASEGAFLAIIPEKQAEQALQGLKNRFPHREARRIGVAIPRGSHPVTLTTSVGTRRVLDPLLHDTLPRIC